MRVAPGVYSRCHKYHLQMYVHSQNHIPWLFPACGAEVGAFEQVLIIKDILDIERGRNGCAAIEMESVSCREIEYPGGCCVGRLIEIEQARSKMWIVS